MKKLLVICILFLAVMTIDARKLYIDYGAANNSANGTSTATPWKVCPYMQTWDGTYTHAAGDTFIFKGGVTWPNACFPMNITTGGSATHRDYYGVDKTWYTGGSWARPIFDMGAAQTATTNIVLSLTIDAASNIYFDKIEITGFYWSGAQGFMKGDIIVYTRNVNLTFDSLYIHNWTHDTYANGTTDGMRLFAGYTSLPAGDSNVVIKNCEMSGLPSGTTSGCGIYGHVSIVQNCLIHDLCNAMIVSPAGPSSGDLIVRNNTVYNLSNSYDPTQHENGYYMMGAGYCYNNILHDVGTGVMAYYISPGFGTYSEDNLYVYNNVAYNIGSNNAGMVIDCETGNYSGTVYILNNTCIGNASGTGPCLTVVACATDTVNAAFIQNNHWITSSGSPVLYNSMPSYGVIKTVTIDHNLTMSPATATSQGYVIGNNFAPTDASNGTIDAGASKASIFTTDFSGATRPLGIAWDVGAYEFSGQCFIKIH
jgi:hypothetical protein